MTREEALKSIRQYFTGIRIALSNKTKEAFNFLIPELAESEDERIRKFLIDILSSGTWRMEWPFSTADCVAYLEKQKDASKATEAVERIDKYIDQQVANAHDMEDSNPDKKYYLGWDGALGEIGGILQDVYSGEKQKEQKPDDDPLDDPKFIKGFDTGREVQRIFDEQKPAEWSEEDLENLDNILWLCENCEKGIENTWIPSQAIEIKNLINRIKSTAPIKQERSEEDEKMIECIISTIRGHIHSVTKGKEGTDYESYIEKEIAWLKSLRPSWKPSDRPVWRIWKNGACGNSEGNPIALVKTYSGYKLVSCLGAGGEKYIMLSDLEKLPGFNEK